MKASVMKVIGARILIWIPGERTRTMRLPGNSHQRRKAIRQYERAFECKADKSRRVGNRA